MSVGMNHRKSSCTFIIGTVGALMADFAVHEDSPFFAPHRETVGAMTLKDPRIFYKLILKWIRLGISARKLSTISAHEL